MKWVLYLSVGMTCALLWAVITHAASITITCDNDYVLYLNGQQIASEGAWFTPETWAADLRPGKNVVAVFGHDGSPPAHYCGNGQGLIMEINVGDGQLIATDANWRASIDSLNVNG